MSRDREYAARLFIAWLNERYRAAFRLAADGEGGLFQASRENGVAMRIATAELFEAEAAWRDRRVELARRLDQARPGSYLLWVPPGGELPTGEPEESEWARRVVLAASRLASGRSGEARFPARLLLGKVRDEGGYATVTGGLGRHWAAIAARLTGSFYLDSRALNRFTRNEEEREQLFEHIGLVGQGLATGDAVEFEHEDAWTVQRLPRAEGLEDGWAITGCPPGFDPNDGAAVRRVLRKRLTEGAQALGGAGNAAKALVLIGAYDYMENENAGPALRGFDPSLTLPFDVIGLVADGEVKPVLLSRALRQRLGSEAE